MRYEAVGGLNPRGGPVALCPGGSNRLTGELAPEFWGASCDALEHEEGGLFKKDGRARRDPRQGAHARRGPGDAALQRRVARRRRGSDRSRGSAVARSSSSRSTFNRRFIATVPKEHDPTALRETFSPGFLDWAAQIEADVDFGVSERQLYFLWRLRERTLEEYAEALDSAGGLFRRVRSEVEEHGVHTYAVGPVARGPGAVSRRLDDRAARSPRRRASAFASPRLSRTGRRSA